jgi:hypothetical protein
MSPTATGNATTVGKPDGNTKTAALDPKQGAGAPASATATDMELEFWRSVKTSNKPEELNAYIARYPGGSFESLARARIAELQAAKDNPNAAVTRTTAPVEVDPAVHTTDATTQTEDDLGLDRNTRRLVQKRLKALGFETPVSGKFNEETRHAINSWQSARGYPQSGFLNKLQLDALKQEALPKTASKDDDEEESSGKSSRRASRGGGGGRVVVNPVGRLFRGVFGR